MFLRNTTKRTTTGTRRDVATIKPQTKGVPPEEYATHSDLAGAEDFFVDQPDTVDGRTSLFSGKGEGVHSSNKEWSVAQGSGFSFCDQIPSLDTILGGRQVKQLDVRFQGVHRGLLAHLDDGTKATFDFYGGGGYSCATYKSVDVLPRMQVMHIQGDSKKNNADEDCCTVNRAILERYVSLAQTTIDKGKAKLLPIWDKEYNCHTLLAKTLDDTHVLHVKRRLPWWGSFESSAGLGKKIVVGGGQSISLFPGSILSASHRSEVFSQSRPLLASLDLAVPRSVLEKNSRLCLKQLVPKRLGYLDLAVRSDEDIDAVEEKEQERRKEMQYFMEQLNSLRIVMHNEKQAEEAAKAIKRICELALRDLKIIRKKGAELFKEDQEKQSLHGVIDLMKRVIPNYNDIPEEVTKVCIDLVASFLDGPYVNTHVVAAMRAALKGAGEGKLEAEVLQDVFNAVQDSKYVARQAAINSAANKSNFVVSKPVINKSP